MKIAIALANKDINGPIGQSFGRAGFFGIFDTNSNEYQYIENTASAHHGGAGVSASQLIIDQDVTVLLIPRCGENAYRVLDGAGVDLFATIYASGIENITAYQNGKLPKLNVSSAGAHKPCE